MEYYKVVYYNREKLPEKKKGKITKVCFLKGDKKEYLYLNKEGKLETKNGNKSYSFCIEKLQVMRHPAANKIVNRIMHSIR